MEQDGCKREPQGVGLVEKKGAEYEKMKQFVLRVAVHDSWDCCWTKCLREYVDEANALCREVVSDEEISSAFDSLGQSW